MSLEKLFVSDYLDWDEVETGVVMLVTPTFTQEFHDWLAEHDFHIPENLDEDDLYLNLVHGFCTEFPVVVSLSGNTEVIWKYEMGQADFCQFISQQQ